MEISVEHLGDVQFEIRSRNHTLVVDQPVENGGYDEGMTPPELLLASLGSCAAYYAVQYLRARSLPLEGLRVRVSAQKTKGPARLADFQIELDYPGALDQRQREGVMRSVHSCLIHNTLLNPPKIEIALNDATPVPA